MAALFEYAMRCDAHEHVLETSYGRRRRRGRRVPQCLCSTGGVVPALGSPVGRGGGIPDDNEDGERGEAVFGRYGATHTTSLLTPYTNTRVMTVCAS
jgi:hypothetical protein